MERVRMIEMGGGCREDDDMRERETRGWRRGGVSAACFTCRSGNAALRSVRLRPSVGALRPTPVSAHKRLCVSVYMGVFTQQSGMHLAPQPHIGSDTSNAQQQHCPRSIFHSTGGSK